MPASALAELSDGDARRALSVLEAAAQHVGDHGGIDAGVVRDTLARRVPIFDKDREQHYDLISALHKSVRGSDPQASLYWLARILGGGEDPMYVARRLVRMASEDIGLADPQRGANRPSQRGTHGISSAVRKANSHWRRPWSTWRRRRSRIGSMLAWSAARDRAAETPAAPVPLHIRNAPTGLMKELGYGAGYQYAHDSPTGYVPQAYLPDALADATFYEPSAFGHEKRIAERLKWWKDHG